MIPQHAPPRPPQMGGGSDGIGNLALNVGGDGGGMVNWHPNQQYMMEIIQILHQAHSPDNAVQQQVSQAFHKLNELADAACYLACIFANKSESAEIRQVAGLTLKNHISPYNPNLVDQVLSFCKRAVLLCIDDDEKSVRSAAGSVIAAILCLKGCSSWPESLQTLLSSLQSNENEGVIDGAFGCLCKIVEDQFALHPLWQDHDPVFLSFCQNQLLPQLFTLLSPQAKTFVRRHAISCLTPFINCHAFAPGAPIEALFPQFWQVLGSLATESDHELRRPIVQGMIQVVEFRPEAVLASADAVMSMMVECSDDPEYRVRLAAMEFWPAILSSPSPYYASSSNSFTAYSTSQSFCDDNGDGQPNNGGNACNASNGSTGDIGDCINTMGGCNGDGSSLGGPNCNSNNVGMPVVKRKAIEAVKNHLSRLLPILVKNTIYSQWDYLGMDQGQFEDDNANVADEEHDMKPRFHRSSNHQSKCGGGGDDANRDGSHPDRDGGSGDGDHNFKALHSDDDYDDEFDDDDDDASKTTWGGTWTVRKGAALALDHLATVYRHDILPDVLPIVEKQLVDENWEVRESAVLTLGAIAQGCIDELAPYLPRVLEFLLKMCDDARPLVRSISCWCVSRYSKWIVHPNNSDQWLKPVLAIILKHVLDRNKRVQEAACSAFATVEEFAQHLLHPFLHDIISTLNQAFQFYQSKNLLILLDAVGTLAECVGGELATDQLSDKLMRPLFSKLESTNDHEASIVALFECMSCVVNALGKSFLPYTIPVIRRCCQVIEGTNNEVKRYRRGECSEGPNRELLESALDLLSCIAETLGEDLPILLKNEQSLINFIPLAVECCDDTEPGVLQASFALMGDLSRFCVDLLSPYLPRIMPTLSQNIAHQRPSVSNNAGWAIGEISLRAGREHVEPHIDRIASQLVAIITAPELHRSLLQNVCITLGRLGLVCSHKMTAFLPQFLTPWCRIMKLGPNDSEKATSFEGVCTLILLTPEVCGDSFLDIIHSILSSQVTLSSSCLEDLFNRVLRTLIDRFPHRWMTIWHGGLLNNGGNTNQNSSSNNAPNHPSHQQLPPLNGFMQQQLIKRFNITPPPQPPSPSIAGS